MSTNTFGTVRAVRDRQTPLDTAARTLLSLDLSGVDNGSPWGRLSTAAAECSYCWMRRMCATNHASSDRHCRHATWNS